MVLHTCLDLDLSQRMLGGRIAVDAVVVPAHHEELEVIPELPVPRPPDSQQRGFLALGLAAVLSVMEWN